MVRKSSGKRSKSMRSFTIDYALNKKGCPTKFYNKDYTGRYISRDAASAAKKAASQLCKVKRVQGECVLYIEMKETTQGKSGKILKYRVTRKKLKTPGPFGNEYELIAKSMNKQSSRIKEPVCKSPGKSSGRKISKKNINKLLKSMK